LYESVGKWGEYQDHARSIIDANRRLIDGARHAVNRLVAQPVKVRPMVDSFASLPSAVHNGQSSRVVPLRSVDKVPASLSASGRIHPLGEPPSSSSSTVYPSDTSAAAVVGVASWAVSRKIAPMPTVPYADETRQQEPHAKDGLTFQAADASPLWSSQKVHPDKTPVPVVELEENLQPNRSTLRGTILHAWWATIQEEHMLLAVCFSRDTIFTRPERIMVAGLFVLFTMFINCLLFEIAGNASKGRTFWLVFYHQIRFIAVTTICTVDNPRRLILYFLS
jgi:hypothetical protein